MCTTTCLKGAVSVVTLGLALLIGGCSGSGVTPDGTRLSSQSAVRPLDGTCQAVSSSLNFNGTAIPPDAMIWFSSVFSVPGYKGPLTLTMSSSTITFTSGGQTYSVQGPGMAVTLQSSQTVNFGITSGQWYLTAPYGTAGNDFLNGMAYFTPSGLPGGIKKVTWSAVFQSPTRHQIHWRWSAAVYNTFTGQYDQLGVKPLDDSSFAPYNSDRAGTPENYKQYVIGGGTGRGGSDYTGRYGRTLPVWPCTS